MADQTLFSRTTLIVLVACASLALGLSIWFQMQRREETMTTVGPSTFSRSALGHLTFYETLRRLDWSVARSARDVADGPGAGGVLVIAEPDLDLLRRKLGRNCASGKRDCGRIDVPATVLLVLPKQFGYADWNRPGWVRKVRPIELSDSARVLNFFTSGATLLRGSLPARWTTSTLGVEPEITRDLQLIRKPVNAGTPRRETITPIIASDEGILLGEIRDGWRRILVLSDPDPIENHGITRGDNARFAVALAERLRRGDGRLVFDETVHDFRYARSGSPKQKDAPARAGDSPLSVLAQFPFSLLAAQCAATMALLLWATMARFGPAEKPGAAAIHYGKTRLIENTAALLGAAGHQASTLRRYLQMVQRETARALHAPGGIDEAAQVAWLDQIGKVRGVRLSLSGIIAQHVRRGASSAPEAALFVTANAIHSWSKEILNGPARGKADR
ncbi:MAG: hypothetical protein FWD68_02145 [Alphaproteobacteria bacterium]|nr:hypothetical protein [Alphaproteobacteria bacterium]